MVAAPADHVQGSGTGGELPFRCRMQPHNAQRPPHHTSGRATIHADTSYSPASETETEQKQADPLPATLDDDIDERDVRVVPGTGGPDDVGDVDVDPADLNLPFRSAQGGTA